MVRDEDGEYSILFTDDVHHPTEFLGNPYEYNDEIEWNGEIEYEYYYHIWDEEMLDENGALGTEEDEVVTTKELATEAKEASDLLLIIVFAAGGLILIVAVAICCYISRNKMLS